MEKEKSDLAQSIVKLWEEKKYDEASEAIVQTNGFDRMEIIKHINLDLLSKQALVHFLEGLSLDEWELCKGWDLLTDNDDKLVLSILIKKYQIEFNAADLPIKIKMFAEVKNDYNQHPSKDSQKSSWEFMQKNWQNLVHLIKDLETGLQICKTLEINDPNNLWDSVAALQTIKVVCKNKNVAETESIYPLLKKNFQNEMKDPVKIIIAQEILKKMEQ
jgi:hypothetical protein